MRRWTMFQLRLRTAFSRGAVESELDEELRYHIERQIDVDIARGMSPREARSAALREFGGYQQKKEECRDMRGFNMIDNLFRDIVFAFRQLRKNLLFSGTAIFMLALGICASVAIFVFVDAALLKPLPYTDPSKLLSVYEVAPGCEQCNLSWQDYEDWEKNNKTFRSLDVYWHNGFTLTTADGAVPAGGAWVSAGFFQTLGVAPILGRAFNPGEDQPAAPRTAILTYSTWQRRYGGRKDVLNQSVVLDGDSYIVVGVLPPDFQFVPAEPSEYWLPIHATGGCLSRRSCHSLNGVGRLKDGVSQATALADLKLIARQLEQQYPDSNRDQGATVAPLDDAIVGNIRPILLVLLGGATLLLSIATINVASLLLVRSEARRREISVRAALGAGRSRLMRQFLAEGLVLVGIGAVVGLIGASQVIRLLTALIPARLLEHMPMFADIHLSASAILFAVGVSFVAALLFSLAPSFRISLSGISSGMSEGGRASAGLTWRSMGSKLVVLELATAVVLLVGAGLLGRSLALLLRVDVGFEPSHLASLLLVAPDKTYPHTPEVVALERRLKDRLQALPDVQSMGITSSIPVSGWGNTTWIKFVGRPWHGEHNDTPFRDVSTGYFKTIGATLIRGRGFTADDTADKPLVLVVNESFAKLHFAGQDPIGRQIQQLGDNAKPMTIVGVVADIKEGSLDAPNRPVLYFPFDQNPDSSFYVLVRTTRSEAALIAALRSTIHDLDPGIVTVQEQTMNARIDESQSAWIHRSSAWMVGGFACTALVLSVIGLYGVIAYSVGQRTREIGIRMALGARTQSVNRMVLKEATVLTGLGIAIGLACAIAAAKLLRDLLYGVQSWDIPTLIAVAAVLTAAALAASYIPARRAADVNPMEALRTE
ncbi:MAG TPA: ABC transporter permease [Bryobacteraceae bacterium]|nr:ABC transporter permease [Bryobacteraceae bacterium]